MYKIGILSDTHGLVSFAERARRLLEEQGVSLIIHCGDIGGETVVKVFEGIETHFVYGNGDGENEILRQAATATGNTMHGWIGFLERHGKRICFLHGHRNRDFDSVLNSGAWDLVCVGHTHVPMLEQHGKTLLLNPGAFERVRTPTIAVVDLDDMSVQTIIVQSAFVF